MSMSRLIVLCSGSGSNLQAILDAVSAGEIPAQMVGVLADRPCFALARAEKSGIPITCIERSSYQNQRDFQNDMLAAMQGYAPDAVVLAGYISILNEETIQAFSHKIINVHPALLPLFGGKGFYGRHVHQAVLDAGCKVTGATVHFVEYGVDQGPIIAQQCIPVYANDSVEDIAERIHPIEHALLVESTKLLCGGKLSIKGRTVHIEEASL